MATPASTPAKYPPGTQVKLTGKFLRSTGQGVGSEGQKRWTVQPCSCGLCKRGGHIRTDEPMTVDYSSPNDPPEEREALKWRHLAIGNVFKVGPDKVELTVRNCP